MSWLFLLVLAVAFTWLVARSIRAGHGKVIFWLAWFLIGLSVLLTMQPPLSYLGRTFSTLWMISVLGLPVWWSVKALHRASRRSETRD